MAIKRKSIEKISSLLSKKLSIPSYQRPYRWPERLVLQLIQDLLMYKEKKAYRLGTIVLYQKTREVN